MRILMVSAEYAPFAKTGGLADMVTGLSKALVIAGHDVRVVLPHYPGLELDPRDGLTGTPMVLDGLEVSPVVLDGSHPAYAFRQVVGTRGPEPRLYQIDAPGFFGSGAIYGGGEREARRFALLAHAALRLCAVLDWSPEIIHCHDWHAALLPVLLSNAYGRTRQLRGASSVLTIHNIGYQGVFAGTLAAELGLLSKPSPAAVAPRLIPQPADDLNFLRDGISAADALTTVSPSHGLEILTPEYGKGLDSLLRQRRNRLVGILNGVDYTAWNPATDARLPAHYQPQDLSGKALCRAALLAHAGLTPGPPGPLLGMVTRLAEQKGIELVIEALPPLLHRRQVQLVILGQGEERYASQLRQLALTFPDLFRYFEAQDESLARLIFGGADCFLVPSIYEPCGLTQMYALRYGAVPIVRETGGLKDTVRHFDAESRTGTGAVFKHPDSAGLSWAIGEAIGWFRQPSLWGQIQQNGMAEDYSWSHQAPHYEALYARLTGTAA